MRDIKFRAWDKKRKIMIGSDYPKNWGDEKDEWYTDIHKMDLVGIETISNDDQFEVMQYTGLKDQNGKEIYEGDIIINPCIVSPACPHCGKKLYAERQPEVVKWNNISHRFDMPYIDAFQEYLILGNIHENPELLEVTKKV